MMIGLSRLGVLPAGMKWFETSPDLSGYSHLPGSMAGGLHSWGFITPGPYGSLRPAFWSAGALSSMQVIFCELQPDQEAMTIFILT